MFLFGSKKSKANATLLDYARRSDTFTFVPLVELFTRNKGHIDINTTDKQGNTPLILSIAAKNVVHIHVLMQEGANIGLANKAGDTPLMVALAANMDGIARDLIAGGVDVTVKNKAGVTAADVAAKSTSPDILSLVPYLKGEKLLDELKAAIAAATPNARVIEAAKDYVVKALQNALDAGGSADSVDRNGISALAWVSANNNKAGAELLLERGAKVDFQPTPKSPTALHTAAARGSDGAVDLLLKAGADTAIAVDGKTAFDIALASNSPKSAVLIADAELSRAKNDAEKAVATKKKATAELVAGLHDNNPFMVLAALKAGASTDVIVKDGFSLVTRAARTGDNKTLALLLDAGADVNKPDAQGRVPIVEAASTHNSLAVQELIKRGANVNAQDAEKETALSRMMVWDDRTTMNALIDAKADPSLPGRQGYTVLETLARWEGSTALIKRFGENKTDMNRKGREGLTPLMMAVQATWKDNALAFIEAGADVLAKTDKGVSVLDMVKKNGWADIAAKIEAVQKAQQAVAVPVAIPAAKPPEAPKPAA